MAGARKHRDRILREEFLDELVHQLAAAWVDALGAVHENGRGGETDTVELGQDDAGHLRGHDEEDQRRILHFGDVRGGPDRGG